MPQENINIDTLCYEYLYSPQILIDTLYYEYLGKSN